MSVLILKTSLQKPLSEPDIASALPWALPALDPALNPPSFIVPGVVVVDGGEDELEISPSSLES